MWFLLANACKEPTIPAVGDDDDDTDTTPPVTADSPVLTVEHGFGGGQVAAGATVQVWADVDPQAEIVTGWSDPSLPPEWNGTLVMPDHDLTVSPTIEVVETPIAARTYTLDGRERDVLVVAAPSPVGLVLFFHGAGYAIDELRDNAAATITKHLLRAGYTVVAVQSEAEASAGTGGWNGALSGSTDLDNVVALVDALHVDGTVPESAPIVAWGMSSGGIFAHTVGAALPADVVLASCAAGGADVLAATSARTGWYLAGNDQTFPTSVADAGLYDAELKARGIATDLYVHPPTPLYDQRFERVTGIDAARSAAIAASIRASGAVDGNDAWTVPGSAVDVDLDDLSADQATAVRAEIEIMAADHELYDDVAARMVAFVTAAR